MILINSVILFFSKIYETRLSTKKFLNNDDHVAYIINKNNKSIDNLFNNTSYYYDNEKNTFKNRNNNLLDGYDIRENIIDNNISIYNISVFLYKKNILDLLIKNDVSIYRKLNYIEEYNKLFNENKYFNIYACNLMDDWEF
jgi:hypothetical protein